MTGQGLDLRHGTIPGQSGNLGFALFALQIQLMLLAYAASLCRLVFPISPKDRDKETQRWDWKNAIGTLAFYRLSRFDRASSIAGMAEFGSGDRLGPRHVW